MDLVASRVLTFTVEARGNPKKVGSFLVIFELLCMPLSGLDNFYSLFHSYYKSTEAVITVFFTCSVQISRLGQVLAAMRFTRSKPVRVFCNNHLALNHDITQSATEIQHKARLFLLYVSAHYSMSGFGTKLN